MTLLQVELLRIHILLALQQLEVEAEIWDALSLVTAEVTEVLAVTGVVVLEGTLEMVVLVQLIQMVVGLVVAAAAAVAAVDVPFLAAALVVAVVVVQDC
jgi:hypothetical protein